MTYTSKNQGMEAGKWETHATMYVGWTKGWAVFHLAKEVWGDGQPAGV